MITLQQIHAEAKDYSPDCEPLRDAFIAGARWMATGKYYKPAELFDRTSMELEDATAEIQKENEGFVPSFNDWWCAYGKKRGRKKAEAKWNRLCAADKIACMKATPAYVSSIDDKMYQKDPLTYLNGECWNDELIFKQDYEQRRIQRLTDKAARILGAE